LAQIDNHFTLPNFASQNLGGQDRIRLINLLGFFISVVELTNAGSIVIDKPTGGLTKSTSWA